MTPPLFEPGSIMSQVFWPTLKPFLPIYIGLLSVAALFKILEAFLEVKEGRYFLKRYKVDFFTLIFAIAGYTISYALSSRPGLSFIFNVGTTIVAVAIIAYSKTKEKDFYFLPLRRPTEKEDWIGEGVFQYERSHQTFTVTNSYSGFIFSKTLIWSDYVFDFEFKVLQTSLGVILRATNLSNLVMLQIGENGIRPHIRVSGFWSIVEPEQAGLLFAKKLDFDKWYRANFECDKNSIRIRLYQINNVDERTSGEALVFDRVWSIPSGQMTFSYKPEKNVGLITQAAISSIPFPINLEYGTVGFRNDGKEKALVKNVLIEKL